MKFTQVKKIVNQIQATTDPEVKVRFKDAMGNASIADLVSIKEEITHAEESPGSRIVIFDATAEN